MRDYEEYEPCQPREGEDHDDAYARVAYGPSGRRLGFGRMGHVTDVQGRVSKGSHFGGTLDAVSIQAEGTKKETR